MQDSDDRQACPIGWREWVALPELGIPHIKAKIDTGARTSALHTFALDTFRKNGVLKARFQVHPFQRRRDIVRDCVAEVIDRRWVTDSGGHKERRYVINTAITLGGLTWYTEVTLTNRDNMRFRMLLGRTAMTGRFIIDPAASYLVGRVPRREERRRIR